MWEKKKRMSGNRSTQQSSFFMFSLKNEYPSLSIVSWYEKSYRNYLRIYEYKIVMRCKRRGYFTLKNTNINFFLKKSISRNFFSSFSSFIRNSKVISFLVDLSHFFCYFAVRWTARFLYSFDYIRLFEFQ